MQKSGKFIYLSVVILFLLSLAALANEDSTSYNFLYGVNKQINFFNFIGDADIAILSGFGNFDITQTYNGTIYTDYSKRITDDENFRLNYLLPVTSNFSVISSNNFSIYKNNEQGVSDPDRIRSGVGAEYLFFNGSLLRFLGGIEKNTLYDINSSGPFFELNSDIQSYDADGFLLSGGLKSDYLKLPGSTLSGNTAREDYDLIASANILKFVDRYNSMDLSVNYKLQNRDFLTPLINEGKSLLNVESRLEKTISAELTTDFILVGLPIDLNLSISDTINEKTYSSFFIDKKETGVVRNNHYLSMLFNGQTEYRKGNFLQTAGLYFELLNQEYDVSDRFGLDETDLQKITSRERQRNNITEITRLFGSTSYSISPNDTIISNYLISMLRYDTPSDNNNEDKDILTTIIGAGYSKRFSDVLSASLKLDVFMNHKVYIKAENSSNNLWLRLIRLSPKIDYRLKNFSMRPTLHILANYTVYDFNLSPSAIRSISFREIEYNDSISVRLSKRFEIFSNILLRYSERGKLIWNTFEEIPADDKVEQFIRLMIMFDKTNIRAGIGFRYYNIADNKLLRVSGLNSSKTRNSTISPETYFKYILNGGSQIIFNGWYDFQEVDGKKLGRPKFLLTSNLVF